MPQDHTSGAAANAWGHAMAQKVANHLGATLVGNKNSNEANWKGKSISIKSAKYGNTLIGVTLPILNRVQSVVAALQESHGTFSLFEVSSSWYSNQMRVPPNKPNIGMVRCDLIRSTGKALGVMK